MKSIVFKSAQEVCVEEKAIQILEGGFIDFGLLLTEASPEEAPEQFPRILKGTTNTIKMLFKM